MRITGRRIREVAEGWFVGDVIFANALETILAAFFGGTACFVVRFLRVHPRVLCRAAVRVAGRSCFNHGT